MKLRRLTAAQLLALSSFPRISPDEEFLLRDFLREYGRHYDAFDVDVPVGRGASVVNAESGLVDRMWSAITRRRIDLVGYQRYGVDIIEAKVCAIASTVTQVRDYCRLYTLEHAQPLDVRPFIVCRQASSTVNAAMLLCGGLVLELPAIVGERGVGSFTSQQELSHD